MLNKPVRALQEGGLPRARRSARRCSSCAAPSRTSTPARPGASASCSADPFGDKVEDYFRKYQSAQSHLNGDPARLRNGQDELAKDNVALNLEKQNLWAAMGRLNQYVYVAERLDARLSAKIAELEASDPERAKALRRTCCSTSGRSTRTC